MAMTRPKKDPEAKRGRPPSDTAARETFQFRVDAERRSKWQAAAEERAQSESAWAREALDAWVLVCRQAAALEVEPTAFVTQALEDHARVRAAVAELTSARALTTTEARLLRILAPTAWARRNPS
jgi:hypothetical protein